MDLLCLFNDHINFRLGRPREVTRGIPQSIYINLPPHPNPISPQTIHKFSSSHYLRIKLSKPFSYTIATIRISASILSKSAINKMSSPASSLTLTENELKVLRAVLDQIYYKVDTKELGKELGDITANAASKRFKRVKDKITAADDNSDQGWIQL
jgi:predicted DNA binding protein